MKTGWCLMLVIAGMATRLPATDPVLRRSVIVIEQGKVNISAPNAAASQTLGVWVRQSMSTLETLWKTEIPFQTDQPLELVMDPGLEKVELWERWQGGILRQRIGIPEDPERQDPLALADALTRALSHRGLLAATSGEWVDAPGWWVRGHSLHLLKGGAAAALEEWIQASEWTWTYPELLVARTPAAPVSLEARAEDLLFCRWVRQQTVGAPVWRWLAAWDPTAASTQLQALSGSADLRELHIRWTLWTEADRDALLSEYRLEEVVVTELKDRVRVHPALLGVTGLPDRYRSLDLEEIQAWIHLEGMEELMTRWSLRLQPLAFRQSDEVHRVIKGYLDAGLALGDAAASRGRKRQQDLERFQKTFLEARNGHHALLLGMEPAER